jgi:hypothetical protein
MILYQKKADERRKLYNSIFMSGLWLSIIGMVRKSCWCVSLFVRRLMDKSVVMPQNGLLGPPEKFTTLSLFRKAEVCSPIAAHFSLSIAHTPGSASCWKMLSICSGG